MSSTPSAEISKGDADYVAYDKEPKRGHVFCGCCCDVRVACLVVNVIALAFAGLGLVSLAPHMDRPGFDRFGFFMVAFVIGIVANSLGLYGALKFKKLFVLIAAIWFAFEALLSIILFTDFVGFGFGLFFLYPHIVFLKELHNGTIGKETYPREKDCCSTCL